MQIFTEILGNIHSPEWEKKIDGFHVESIILDQWTAQKSRFLAKSDHATNIPWHSSASRRL